MASSLSRGGHKELGEGAGRSSYPTTSKGSCCASQQICLPMTEMGHLLPRHSTGGAAEVPLIADTPSRDRRSG